MSNKQIGKLNFEKKLYDMHKISVINEETRKTVSTCHKYKQGVS
jgi:hypothetical protein